MIRKPHSVVLLAALGAGGLSMVGARAENTKETPQVATYNDSSQIYDGAQSVTPADSEFDAARRDDDFVGPLRLVLRAYLPDGSPSIGLAAKLAGTTVRTLQRRLADLGTTYSQLLDDLRHDVAIYLLRDPNRQAADVSRELGYCDPAIFTRAFRRWTGMTPSKFRRDISVS